MPKRRSGFTLIELLVVIAIIAILAAILFPVFTNAKQAGYRTKCLSNTKQLASALMVYKDDYSGCWPACYYVTDPNTPAEIKKYYFSFWMPMIRPYIKNGMVFRCPSATKKYSDFADENAPIKQEFPAANYGMNEYLVHQRAGMEIAKTDYTKEGVVRFPTKTALLADCMSTLFNDWNDGGVPTAGPDGVQLTCGQLRIKYANTYKSPSTGVPPFNKGVARHDGEQVVFADGHAQTVKLQDFKYYWKDNATYEYPIIRPDNFGAK